MPRAWLKKWAILHFIGDQMIAFRLYDPIGREVVGVYEKVSYVQDSQYGLPDSPEILHAGPIVLDIDEENIVTLIRLMPNRYQPARLIRGWCTWAKMAANGQAHKRYCGKKTFEVASSPKIVVSSPLINQIRRAGASLWRCIIRAR